MPGLRSVFKELRDAVGAQGDACIISNLSLDDSTVTISFHAASGTKTVNLVYTDGDSYPHCGVLVLCEQADDLSHLAERFMDKAPLLEVMRQVFKHYNLDRSAVDSLLPAATNSCAMSETGEDMDMDGCSNGDGSAGNGDGQLSEDDDYEGSEDGEGDYDQEASDDDDDDDVEMQDDEEERELLTLCEKKRSRWRQHEQALEDAEAEAAQNLSATQSQAAKLQIFNTQEAFTMLCKEMIDLIKENHSGNIQLIPDTVGDDIYYWNIELASFDPASPLAEDLSKVYKLHSYSTVILRLHFTRGLHPFYPPSVEIIRPHLRPPILGAVAAHPMLQLANWDPWRPQRELIDQIKQFLEQNARVDIQHPRNNMEQYPSAYSPLEQQLARMEALSGLPIMALDKYKHIYDATWHYKRDSAHLEALQRKKRGRSESGDKPQGEQAAGGAPAASGSGGGKAGAGQQRYWAAGTGYGHTGTDSGAVWDSKQAEIAQKAQDDEKQSVLDQLCDSLAAALRGDGEPDAGEASSSTCLTQQERERCIQQVEESCLVPFLVSELGLPSFTDMISRAHYYTTLFKLVRELCRPASRRLLTLAYNSKCVADVAVTGKDSATKFLALVSQFQLPPEAPDAAASAQAAAAAGSSAPNNKKPKTAAGSTASASAPAAPPAPATAASVASGASASASAAAAAAAAANQLTAEEVHGARLAEVMVDVERRLSQQGCSSSARQPAQLQGLSPYLAALKPLQLEYLTEFGGAHEYGRKVASESVQPKERVMRLAKEVAGLQSLLPLTESSSIHVRILETNIALWKALIIGPEDTPYSGACFLFDLYFPPTYPKLAPMVLLKTTGGGTVRFNPNLYNCGKVCLSLLGTWSGARGETWNPDHSTALQILISIQSLILVPQPYFNEPGFEKSINTDQGARQSRDYNKVIREASVSRAMIDPLRKPPPEFKSVIETHFALRGDYILNNVQQWVDEARAHDAAHADSLAALRSELQGLISRVQREQAAAH